MFYPDIKKHMSPTSIDMWHNSRGAFIKSYFLGEKGKETSSMKGGTTVHKLIELGALNTEHKYQNNEVEIHIPLGNGVEVFGKPDSYSEYDELESCIAFVDYKSGRENTWNDAKLATDIKMLATAWLVWNRTAIVSGKYAQTVIGFIDYIPTEWSEENRKVEPVGDGITVAKKVYTIIELQEFTAFIQKTVEEVNKAYEEWLNSTDAYVSQDDVVLYRELYDKKEEIEKQIGEVKERLVEQFKTGSLNAYSSPVGTFSFRTTKTYQYPPDMKINYLDYGLVLDDVNEILIATATAKQKFEMANEPVKTVKTLSFRAK